MNRPTYTRKAMVALGAVILGVTGICLLVFWLHVTARKAALIEQNFRLVGDMTEHIRDAFFALDTSLTYAAATQVPPAKNPAPTSWTEFFTNLVAQIEPPPTFLSGPPTNAQHGAYNCIRTLVQREPKSYQLILTYTNTIGPREDSTN